MAIRTILIDDNPHSLSQLQELINNIYDVDLAETFHDSESFLKNVKHITFDLCIIDYHLPNMSGIECLKRIPGKPIILTSHQPIPAHEALQHEYITDVILINESLDLWWLEKSIKRVRDEITAKRGYVTFKTYPNNYRQVDLSDILYITIPEKKSKRKLIKLTTEDILTQNYTMEEILNKLPRDRFVQINEHCLIHTNRFHSMDKDDFINIEIQADDEDEKLLPLKLTATYRKHFENLLNLD